MSAPTYDSLTVSTGDPTGLDQADDPGDFTPDPADCDPPAEAGQPDCDLPDGNRGRA